MSSVLISWAIPPVNGAGGAYGIELTAYEVDSPVSNTEAVKSVQLILQSTD